MPTRRSISDELMSSWNRNESRPIRVLLAKPGLDGHNRGVHVIAKALSDAGMEVIYLGLRRSPEEIAVAAIAEDVDVVGLSILSGAHLNLLKSTMSALSKRGAGQLPVVVGGIIPDEDFEKLRVLGACAVLGPGTRLAEVVSAIRTCAAGNGLDPNKPYVSQPA
jgi:methylmalonyl-CoA mutase C-terminal domain/subunit